MCEELLSAEKKSTDLQHVRRVEKTPREYFCRSDALVSHLHRDVSGAACWETRTERGSGSCWTSSKPPPPPAPSLPPKKRNAEWRRLVTSCFVTTVRREFGPKWLQTFAGGVEATCVCSACRLQDDTIRCCLTSCRRRSLGHRGQGVAQGPVCVQRGGAGWDGPMSV